MSLLYRIAFVAARYLVVDGQAAPNDPLSPADYPGPQMHSDDQQRPSMSLVARQRHRSTPLLGARWNGRPDRRAGREHERGDTWSL